MNRSNYEINRDYKRTLKSILQRQQDSKCEELEGKNKKKKCGRNQEAMD